MGNAHAGPRDKSYPPALAAEDGTELATFAGGCFWGLELMFQRIPGVVATSVGYTQGRVERPTYEQVCSGTTGHTEAVQVTFDPSVVGYDVLLDRFFARIDPSTVNGQGNDFGTQYRTGVYTHSEAQHEAAQAKFQRLLASTPGRVATELKPATEFFTAEAYHQQYLEKGGQDASKGATDQIRCYG